MKDIYNQHHAAFRRVSAFVIAKDGQRVATIAFKNPADGAGRKYAYVHWLGLEMVRGHAGGYGYDKASAACASAADKMPLGLEASEGMRFDPRHDYNDFRRAIARDSGRTWQDCLREAGFVVWQAV